MNHEASQVITFNCNNNCNNNSNEQISRDTEWDVNFTTLG